MKLHIAASLLFLSSPLFAQQDQTQEIEVTGASSANVSWDSALGRGYFLQWSTNLVDWNGPEMF